MSWVKVDDQMTRHPKFLSLGKDRLVCQGLWLDGMCYATSYLTDGYVPASALPHGSARFAARLVAAGLWSPDADGYRIHDYHDYQPTRAEALELRRQRSEAGRRGGKRPKSKTPSKPEASASGGASDIAEAKRNPIPSPPAISPANAGDAREVDDLELAVRRLRHGNATEGQLETMRGFVEQLDEATVLGVLNDAYTAKAHDRYGIAQSRLVQLAARRKRGRGSTAVTSLTNYDSLIVSDDDDAAGAA